MHAAPERKLITILAADVAGYSALMGRDEPGTLKQLKASRELMAEEVTRHRGRIFGAAGDSLLAEFASVVNAVECAVRIQRRLAERNARLPEGGRMRFRIGINLGDVLVEGDDLFGEGVNIAARLQALAEPGGILISGAVFEQVRTKLSLTFDALGPQPVKNIAEPVTAWRVVLDPGADGRVPQPSNVGRGGAAAAPAGDPPRGHSREVPRAAPAPLPCARGRVRRLLPRHQPADLSRHAVVPVAIARGSFRARPPRRMGDGQVIAGPF